MMPAQTGSVAYIRESLPKLGKERRVDRHPGVSRTPEGRYGQCPVCRDFVCVEFSHPAGDAPCPSCGQLLWFEELRWPFVCEEQGLPLRETGPRRRRASVPRRLGLLVFHMARHLRLVPRERLARRAETSPTGRPSSSAMYDRWVDG